MPVSEGVSSITILLIEKLSYKGQVCIKVKCGLESVFCNLVLFIFLVSHRFLETDVVVGICKSRKRCE